MPKTRRNVTLSPEEYLRGEQVSDIRHEYESGHAYAMVGASEAHNRIALNLAAALNTHLRGGPCRAFISDMKVRVRDAFYYPDILVTCDRADSEEYYKTLPVLIAEVLSASTIDRDSLAKRIAY